MIEAFTARLELELNRADFLLFISRHSPALSLGLHSPTTAPNQTHRALFRFVISRPAADDDDARRRRVGAAGAGAAVGGVLGELLD